MPELLVHVIEARNVVAQSSSRKVYASMKVKGSRTKGKSKLGNNPNWNQFFLLSFSSPQPLSEELEVSVNSQNRMGKDTCLGLVRIPLETVPKAIEKQEWYPLLPLNGAYTNGEILVGLSAVDFGSSINPPTHAPDSNLTPEIPRSYPQSMYGQPPPVYGQPPPVYGQPVYGQPPPNPYDSMHMHSDYPNSDTPPEEYSKSPPQYAAYPPPQYAAYPPPPQYYAAAPPGAIPVTGTPVFVVNEENLDPKTLKKLRRQRRWRKVLQVTWIVCLVLITVLGFVMLGLYI